MHNGYPRLCIQDVPFRLTVSSLARPLRGEREVQGGERTCQGQMCLWSYFLPFLWEENTFQTDGLVDRERETEKKWYCYLYPKGLGGQSYWVNLWDWSGTMNGVDRCLVITLKKKK